MCSETLSQKQKQERKKTGTVAVHTFTPLIREAETGSPLWVHSQLKLHRDPVSKEKQERVGGVAQWLSAYQV